MQLEPAASVAPQAFAPVESAKSLGLVPVMVGTMLFSVAVPVFESVAANADEVVPLSVLGKVTGELSDATGADPALIEIELLLTAVNPVATADSV
jgi:hypothetical protein